MKRLLMTAVAVCTMAACASTAPLNDTAAWRYTQDELKDSLDDLGMKAKRTYYPIEVENRANYTRLFNERVKEAQRQVGHLSKADIKRARDEAESIWKSNPHL
jgi:hypothetical protein